MGDKQRETMKRNKNSVVRLPRKKKKIFIDATARSEYHMSVRLVKSEILPNSGPYNPLKLV